MLGATAFNLVLAACGSPALVYFQPHRLQETHNPVGVFRTSWTDGWKLFDAKQDSDRWRVYRLNNFSHSTLTLGSQLHNVGGMSVVVPNSLPSQARMRSRT